MGILDKVFGKSRRPASSDAPSSAGAAYSLVNDQSGQVVGLWLADPKNADPLAKGYIEVLLVKHGATHLISAQRRIVSNKADNKGGCFVMFGMQRAPGE